MDRDNMIFIRDNRSVEYGNPDAWLDRATALSEDCRFEEALQAYEIARELMPDLFQNWCDIAAVLCKLCRFEEGLHYYEKALKLNPNDSEAIYGKGTALDNLKRYEEMQMAFEKASELNMVSEENFTMKKYSIEELKSLSKAELLKISDALVNRSRNNILVNFCDRLCYRFVKFVIKVIH